MKVSLLVSVSYISSCLVYKQFFSGRTERYVRWRLVEDDVTRRSEPAEKKRQEMSAMSEGKEDL